MYAILRMRISHEHVHKGKVHMALQELSNSPFLSRGVNGLNGQLTSEELSESPEPCSPNISGDSSWLQVEVCRDFRRDTCPRGEQCRFAHPAAMVMGRDGKVTCCYDFLKVSCIKRRRVVEWHSKSPVGASSSLHKQHQPFFSVHISMAYFGHHA